MITDRVRDQIKTSLSLLRIFKYRIHDDGTVDVDGDVILNRQQLSCFPVKFGTVNGNFECENCPNLTSLVGAPREVRGYFSCLDSPIVTLAGFDTHVTRTLYCDFEKVLSGGICLMTGLTAPHFLPYVGNMGSAPAFNIIRTYIRRPEDIFECQAELIEAGYAEYAE